MPSLTGLGGVGVRRQAIWQRLPHEGKSLVIAQWPQQDATPLYVDQEAVRQFTSVQDLVRTIRNARNQYKVEPARKIQALIAAEGDLGEALKRESAALASFVKADPERLEIRTLEATRAAMAQEDGLQPVHLVVQDGLEAFLPMAGLVDMDKELARLSKQQTTLDKDVEGLAARLAAPGYKDKAPPAVVDKAEAELADKREQLKTVADSIDSILGQMTEVCSSRASAPAPPALAPGPPPLPLYLCRCSRTARAHIRTHAGMRGAADEGMRGACLTLACLSSTIACLAFYPALLAYPRGACPRVQSRGR